MATTKTTKKSVPNFDKNKFYSVEEAVKLVKQTSKTKFNSSIDIAVKLNLDTSKSDQQLRGTLQLPHFFGKQKRILVLDKGLTQKDAKTLEVEHAGDSEVIAEISKGWLDFDLIITTPKMMPELSKLGKILGTRGLMPNPKNGNVTTDLKKTIAEFKKGISSYRTDSYGNIHMLVGKVNSDDKQIIENIEFLLEFIRNKKPAAVKGIYIEKVTLSSTMGPGIKILINKTVTTKKGKASTKVIEEEKDKKENNVFLRQRVKYLRKTKPSKNPENPPVIVETKAKKVKKVVKTKKPVKKTTTKKVVATTTTNTKTNTKKTSLKKTTKKAKK